MRESVIRQKVLAITVLLLLLLPSKAFPAFEIGKPILQYRGYLLSQAAGDLRRDNGLEKVFELRNAAFFELKVDFSDSLQTTLSAVGRHHLACNGESHTTKEIDLYEGYVLFTFGDFDLRLGKQILTWGATDLFSPVNIINPMNYRGFIDPQVEDIRIPILLGSVDYYIGDYSIQILYIPFFEQAQYDIYGTDFSVMKYTSIPSDIDGIWGFLINLGIIPDPAILDALDPGTADQILKALLSSSAPSDNMVDGAELGLRFSGSSASIDFAVSYLYTRSDIPTIEIDPELIDLLVDGDLSFADYLAIVDMTNLSPASSLISTEFKRYHLLGLELSTTIKNITLNAECAGTFDKWYLTKEYDLIRKPTLFYTFSLDFIWGDYTLLGQFFHQVIPDLDKSLLLYDEGLIGFAGAIRASYRDSTLDLDLGGCRAAEKR
ncbi:DUF1302 family protein [Thermodesulfobacteriota bacterium]